MHINVYFKYVHFYLSGLPQQSWGGRQEENNLSFFLAFPSELVLESVYTVHTDAFVTLKSSLKCSKEHLAFRTNVLLSSYRTEPTHCKLSTKMIAMQGF